jgi:hypothetical protein
VMVDESGEPADSRPLDGFVSGSRSQCRRCADDFLQSI